MLRRLLLITVIALFGVVSLVSAQDDDMLYTEACDLDVLHLQVDALWSDYLATRNVDSSTDGALVSITEFTDMIDAIHTECLTEQREARMDKLSALLDNLYDGGYILYVRHTHTDRVGSGDTDRDGCETERNLSTRGRNEAMDINASFSTLNLPISEIISTELCRTLDTTELAFGRPNTIILRSELENTLADVLTVVPPAGTNTIIVAHIGTLNRNFGLPIPFDEGDTYVFRPMGNEGFELVGRIALQDWKLFAEMNE